MIGTDLDVSTRGQSMGVHRMEDYSPYGDFSKLPACKQAKYKSGYNNLVGGFDMEDVPAILQAIKDSPKTLKKLSSLIHRPDQFLNKIVKILKKTKALGLID